VADSPRIEELKRRVQSDPASIAFAALAEEYRRAGRFDEAIDTCTTGLVRHPSYLSAHVTLGRALIEVGRLPDAREELEYVLKLAPENLAAIRGLAEIHHRIGSDEGLDSHDEPSLPVTEAPPPPQIADVHPAIPERPEPIPLRVRTEETFTSFASVSAPVAAPAFVTETMPTVAEPTQPEPHVSFMASVDPALAGLEEFLNAIIRARTERADAR
jgi:tetratricopeptide (TPR) repeat protein